MSSILKDQEIYQIYGDPKPDYLKDKARFYPPFQMHLAWGKKQNIKYFYVHEKIYDQTKKAFENLLECYSVEWINELKINEFGGCYNYRLMRGSNSKLSRHSWAIAIDIHPSENRLRWKKDKAVFGEDIYQHLMDSFYDAGFVNYGIEKGYDFMHFEIGK